jgi:hypothetical protein
MKDRPKLQTCIGSLVLTVFINKKGKYHNSYFQMKSRTKSTRENLTIDSKSQRMSD